MSRISQGTTSRARRARIGFSLIEMVISMVSASVLVGGLATALLVAMRANDPEQGPTRASLASADVLSDMSELQFALSVTEQTLTAVEVTVPDRNDDGSPETIRYAWSGITGDPLTRKYNGGAAYEITGAVHDFEIIYHSSDSQLVYLDVRLQLSSDLASVMESALPLLNRP